MNHLNELLRRRSLRAYVSAFITYVMLAGQLAPLALAAPARAASPRRADARENAAPAHAARPAPAPVFAAPNITATKVDSWDDSGTPDGKAEPGQTITYTVTITNTGDADATGVVFTDSVDPNTTLVPGSVTTQPIAVGESYNVIGNVRIQIPDGAGDLLANDCDPDPNGGPCTNAGLTASGPSTTAQNGNITINSDGSFSYNPAPGFTGTDTVTYTVTDPGGKTDTAVATFKVGNGTGTPGNNVVWFVNPSAPAGGDGRLTNPFNCYTGVTVPGVSTCLSSTAADDPGDIIFLYSGSHTGGNTLTANQKLIGAGSSASLASLGGLTVPTGSDALPATGGASPTITTTNANAVPLGTDNLLRGFTVGNTGTGVKISGTGFGTLIVGNSTTPDVTLNGTGAALFLTTGTLSVAGGFASVTTTSSASQGMQLAGLSDSDGAGGSAFSFGSTSVSGAASQGIIISTTTADLNFGNTSVSATGDAVSIQNNSAGTRTFGTLGATTTGAGTSAFLHAVGGGNVTVSGAATLSTGATGGNPVDIQNAAAAVINFAGGAAVTKTSAGGAGVNLVASSVTFESLGITTSNGPGLSAVTSGTVTVTNNSKSISSTGSAGQAAPAIIANAVTLNANFSSVTSTNSGNTTNGKGISLTNVAGTMNFGTGSITGASDVSFFVTGGNASVTYNGTMTQTTAARVIDVQNKTGGTFAFGGLITSNNGTGRGVFLNSNASSTFNFTAGLALSTAGNDAFTATSSGTLNVTQNNTSIVNTLATTTGQSLKVTSTTIGASGLTFRSIDSNGGTTTNGVTLDTTGNGPFTITGNGTAASGGTLQNKGGTDGNASQGIGIYLNSVGGAVSLTRINVQGNQNYGIRGITVSGGLTLDNSTVGTTAKNGTTYTGVDLDSDTGVVGEGSLRFLNLTGTVVFSNDSFDNGHSRTIFIHNNANSSTLNLSITNSTLRQSLNAGNGGDAGGNSTDAMFLQANNSATMNLTMSNVQLTAYRQFGVLTDARDTATMDIDIGSCTFSNNNTGNVNASTSLNFSGSGSSGNDIFVRYNVHNNTFRHGSAASTPNNGGAHVASGQVSGGGKFDGKVLNNTFGVSGVPFSGAGNAADALRLFASGNKSATTRVTGTNETRYLVQGNTIQRYGEAGIQFNARQGNAVMNVTVLGNIIREPGTAAAGAFAAIWVNSGALPADTNIVNIAIGNANNAAEKNTMQDSDPSNATDVFLDKSTCGGCASQLRLYQNGSDAAGATNEAKASDVLKDDNNPTLDLGPGFTGISSVTIVNATTPPQPTSAVPVVDPLGAPRNRSGFTAPATPTNETTLQQASVTSAPFVSPRKSSPVLVAAPRTTAVTGTASASSAPAAATTTRSASQLDGGALTPVINGAGGTVSVQIGTLAPNDSVTITFQVTVDNPFAGALPQVENQGTVNYNPGSLSTLTNDPDTAAANDKTVTPINAAKIKINDAKQLEPATGTRDMVFTVALTLPATGNVTVNYATEDEPAGPGKAVAGTCGSGGDYVASSGQVAFTAGQQVKTINVPICSDNEVEPDETFLVKLTSPVGAALLNSQATGTITANTPGTLLISELRTRGPGGATDEFVELYNNTGSPINVNGYGVFKMGSGCTGTPTLIATLPNVSIPARGHYLLTGTGYTLANYGGVGAAAGDLTMTADIEDDANVAVFSTTALDSISSLNRLDAVGFGTNVGGVCDLLREGSTLAPVGALDIQYSYFRKECDYVQNVGCVANGYPKETNDNSEDFMFADTAMTNIAGITRRLGAPGPEKVGSPIRRDDSIISVNLLDGSAGKTKDTPPNRERPATSGDPAAGQQFGRLEIRRRVDNTSATTTITRLRFRIMEMTTGPTPPAGTADLRAITSTPVVISGIMDPTTCAKTGTPTTVPCQVTAQATTLETPPAQTVGGGYNSTLSVNIPGGLAPGASIDVNFALGAMQTGTFRFYIIVEALP